NIAKKAYTNSTKVQNKCSVHEKLMVTYYSEHAQNNKIAVLQKIVVIRAKQLAQTNKIKDAYPNIVSQHFSKDLIDLQNKFLSLVLFKHCQYNYDIQYFGNMDKTSLSFDLLYLVTLDKHRAKTIGI
ncbi:32024_t:CDS:2, partial [Gigaspora margarita]